METKRFIGNDMVRLYDRVRRDFGPDAVIVRTRTLMREGAEPLIELTAAPALPLDTGLSLETQEAMVSGVLGRLESVRPGMTVAELEDVVYRVEAEEGVAERELAAPARRLHLQPIESVEAAVPAWEPAPRPAILAHPHHEQARPAAIVAMSDHRPVVDNPELLADLHALGFSAKGAALVAGSAPGADAVEAVALALGARPVRFPDDGRTSLITVHGVAGSGRTTALMKLAIECADGGTEAVLVAGDESAADEVHAFGAVLGLPVYEAFAASDLAMVLQVVPEGACVFADVPAGRWSAPRPIGAIHYGYLAVPADRNPRTLTLSLAGQASSSLAGVILTFCDRAQGLNSALSVVAESPLGVAFVSAGSDVSCGIEVADMSELASGILTTRTREATNGRSFATA